MGLFDKKYCDICGEKIGLIGNRKLENGNLCKSCAKKLSPFFSDRKNSTVEEIKSQLEYRESNQKALENFRATRIIGDYWMIMIDESKKQFVVTQSNDLLKENPDIINISDVLSCNSDVTDYHIEQKYKNEKGEQVSYDPPRYKYNYDFYIEICVNHPYFSNIKIKLNTRSVEVVTEPPRRGMGIFNNAAGSNIHPEYNPEYREYQCMADDIISALMSKPEAAYSAGGNNAAQSLHTEQNPDTIRRAEPSDTWICPFCQMTNSAGNHCGNCGAERPVAAGNTGECSNCGWKANSVQGTPKFCPECGNPLS